MAKVQVLPAHIANKIAAGEVVDRPASVIKELVENAIDAECTKITIVIEQSGKEMIQVIDDGVGMEEEDAILAFERHATSKISAVSDLDRVCTLGFRGEALPSIASVARVEIKTCQRGDEVGTLLKISGGKVDVKEKLAMKPGTTIAVKNLFYNTPARRNFLRADSTELNQIIKWLKRFFLSYPDISFILLHNGEELYNLKSGSLEERIKDVFGKKLFEGLVPVDENLGDIALQGYVCRPDHARGKSDNQFIFLNGRAIVNRSLSHAVAQGYGNLLDRSKYSQFVLFLDIAPNLVDINVHPTKMEVRFANERSIYHLFLSTVRNAIQQEGIIPAFNVRPSAANQDEVSNHFQRMRRPGTAANLRSGKTFQPGPQADQADPSQMTFQYQSMPQQTSEMAQRPVESPPPGGGIQPNLWQIHNRYILSQIRSGLVIIDQHVAHERILYEQIINYLNTDQRMPSQQLLFPQTIEMALEDYLIYTDIKEWLAKIGFVVNELSGRTIVIEAIPADVRVGHESKILFEMIDFYRENEGKTYQPHEKIAAAFSCKNAIKSGEKLSLEAMNALVDQLFMTKEPYFCPHGRPVIVTLGLEEFDRKFKRI